LLAPSSDPALRLTYLGSAATEARLCRLLARPLGSATGGGPLLLLVVPEVAVRELPYALVRGLQDDAARCLDDAGVFASLVDPTQLPAEVP
jgi:hypothetical protein